ncbi:VOC family protein [Bacillus salipaludis]|uniref:VOC family protein n=1 Tax=Bacillus salipaludis TaxID=2547811 RepID=A0ABW8RN22_9BACI
MRFHHYALEVKNMEESLAFYKKYLSFQEESRFSYMGEEIVFLVLGDFRLESISGRQAIDQTAHICFEVSSVREVMNRFAEVRKIEGPYELDNGWNTVFYEGPDREIIEFLQSKLNT